MLKYDFNGNLVQQIGTGNSRGQGMATDGTRLYLSAWNGSSSIFEVYDANLNQVGSFANPTGMGNLTRAC